MKTEIRIIHVPTLAEYAALNRLRASACKKQNNAKKALDNVYGSAKMHAGSVNQR